MSLVEGVLSLVCGLVIVLECAAIADLMRATALPIKVRTVWIAAVILIPVLAAIAWARLAPEFGPVRALPLKSPTAHLPTQSRNRHHA